MNLSKNLFVTVIAVAMVCVAMACGNSDGSSQGASADDSTATASNPGEVIGDAGRGRSEFASEGCSSCHSTGSKRIVGPGLGGISQRHDDAYIRESIVDSQAIIVDGYPRVMPDFSKFSEQKVADLIAYLHTLE
jgi:mono/diheme cytochrome c family protein